MDENSDHPERKDRGQTPSSGIQTVFMPIRPTRFTRFFSDLVWNRKSGVVVRQDRERSDHRGQGQPSLFEETQDAPGSDSEIDTVPTNDDDQNSKDSQRDRDGKKGDRSGGEDKGKEDDNNQYNRFLTGDAITAQANFPVSENSVECARFNKSLEDLVIRLEQSDTEWVSIDCLGRRWISESKEAKIRTTVVVSFSQYPDRAEELRRDLQRAMKDNKLPIEFIRGRVARYVANLFGLREPQAPLVCGSSCAPHGVEGAGTVGGFITIEGDPDRDAVYAVTNHHVIAEDNKDKEKIPWTTGKDSLKPTPKKV
ncbi:hypothetical protein CEP52_008191 [Fusarium oligoseptatum]|uniref:Uncharacterized protein n=1 Tax=Fusarium oligoseptatum TaxID=2604345 RepID=A0A428TJ21_9HYPO|nr:hypothetical protein CEP52_008191 [Fusarium oligoseptatum]